MEVLYNRCVNYIVIEVRQLTKQEFHQLLDEAPNIETRNLKRICETMGIHPFDFFQRKAVEIGGLVINKRPIYFGALTENNGYHLWTFVNDKVKEQFTLYKETKKAVYQWVKKYGELFATMEKGNPKNIKWTKKMGFVTIKETDKLITLKIGGK